MTLEKNSTQTVVAGALGECVHIAGVTNFLRLAENAGWQTVFLGPAVPIAKILETAIREDASPDTAASTHRQPYHIATSPKMFP